ncbi:MAG: T9SS type A sorting domain-containing protein [Fodinibius sp.]|nr:T9SS type A sorting domain-containing protein [Fodinibius sp.]
MTFSLRLFLICVIITLVAVGVNAQQPGQHSLDHNHNIYQKIDQAYQSGDLSLDDKVLYKFYAHNNPQKLPRRFALEEQSVIKCGTPAVLDYRKNKGKLSPSTISAVESMMRVAQIQANETYTSPGGWFAIHYQASGPSAVPPEDSDNDNIPDYVEQVAAAADSSYRHEVLRLGYSDPLDTGQRYDVEIINLSGIYGRTFPPATDDGNTFIQIENDFSENFPPNDDPEGTAVGAVKVTMAHEFKHAIQFTANQWRGETFNWLEMDATLMEEVVYDNVNDYYNYIIWDSSIFNNPSGGFYPGSYEHVSWALYFEERYGSQFWVEVWDIIQQNPQITMVDALTQQLGGPQAFHENYITSQLWHFASGPGNASPNFGFQESGNYPNPPVETNQGFYNKNFSIPRSMPQDSLYSFSAKYYSIPIPENVDGQISLEVSSPTTNRGVGLIAYYNDGRTEAATVPGGGHQTGLSTSNLSWDNIDRLGLVLTNSGTGSSGSNLKEPALVEVGSSNFNSTLSQNYPNPFNPQTRIRFTLEQKSQVELKVYDSAGRLVQTLVNRELSAGLHEPLFDGSGLASGVYFYQLRVDEQAFVKKMTLIK